MKNILPVVTIIITSTALVFVSSDAQEIVHTTAYTHTEKDHIKYKKYTASGSLLRCDSSYTSTAADWSEFPVGTTFRIKGETTVYVIDDYGSALVGTRTIDIYRPTKTLMNKWGVRHVKIEILEEGDLEKSLKILSPRTKYPHCRKMYDAIAAKLKSRNNEALLAQVSS